MWELFFLEDCHCTLRTVWLPCMQSMHISNWHTEPFSFLIDNALKYFSCSLYTSIHNCIWGTNCEISFSPIPESFTNDESKFVQINVRCWQAISHYLSQCWPRSMSPDDVNRPKWDTCNCLFVKEVYICGHTSISIPQMEAYLLMNHNTERVIDRILLTIRFYM